MDLQQLREKLEKIDKKLASLFEERMKVIEKVRVYKNSNNIPVYDSNRERNMHDKYGDYITDKNLMSYYIMFLENVLLISKNYMYDKNQDKLS